MSSPLLFVLVVAAVACGWFLGVWQTKIKAKHTQSSGSQKSLVPRVRLKGVNYLLNDVPDYALDAFLDAVDVNNDNLETHLALGAIHRRRGEIDRAIRIHENLLERYELSTAQQALARFELAQDFMKAGLLDRAETHLQELAERSGSYRSAALYALIEIYQGEQEWQKAVYASVSLEPLVTIEERQRLDHQRSHFHCEIAQSALKKGDFLSARRSIQKAERYCSENERVSLLRMTMDLKLYRFDDAYQIARKKLVVGTELIADFLDGLEQASSGLGHQYSTVLQEIYKDNHSPMILQEIVSSLMLEGDDRNAAAIVMESVEFNFGISEIKLIANLGLSDVIDFDELWQKIKSQPAQEREAGYQCQHCGFEAQKHLWHCPGCRRWETFKDQLKTH